MVVGRIAVEFAIESRYKLRMLGIPILGSCILFGDNQSMITSSTIPFSSLKKKHNAIGYHRIREAIVSRIVDLLHVASKENLADILTKPLGPQQYIKVMTLLQFPLIKMSKHDGECQVKMNEIQANSSNGF